MYIYICIERYKFCSRFYKCETKKPIYIFFICEANFTIQSINYDELIAGMILFFLKKP